MSYEWTKANLGDFVTFKNGKNSPERDDNEGLPVYGSNGIIGYSNASNAPENCLIIGRVGSYCGSVYHSFEQCWVTDNAIIGLPKFDGESEFWYFFLLSLNLNSYRSGSGQPLINQTALKSIPIRVPAKKEVRVEIGKKATLFNHKIELNTQTNQTLEQIAQALFKSWFVDFDPVKAKIAVLQAGGTAEEAELAAMSLIAAKSPAEILALKQTPEKDSRGSAKVAEDGTPRMTYDQLAQIAALFPSAMQESELGQIPEGWDKGTIENIVQFSSERTDVAKLSLNNYISTENMLENKRGITIASSLPGGKSVPAFYENEILISNIRPYFKKIWLTEFKGGRSPDVLGFSTLDPNETEFAYNLLYQDRFFEYMMTTSKGAKMPRGDKDAIKHFSFPLPQKSLRLKFSEQIRYFYLKIRNSNKQSVSLHVLRDTLLPKLLSGEIELKNVNSTFKESET